MISQTNMSKRLQWITAITFHIKKKKKSNFHFNETTLILVDERKKIVFFFMFNYTILIWMDLSTKNSKLFRSLRYFVWKVFAVPTYASIDGSVRSYGNVKNMLTKYLNDCHYTYVSVSMPFREYHIDINRFLELHVFRMHICWSPVFRFDYSSHNNSVRRSFNIATIDDWTRCARNKHYYYFYYYRTHTFE